MLHPWHLCDQRGTRTASSHPGSLLLLSHPRLLWHLHNTGPMLRWERRGWAARQSTRLHSEAAWAGGKLGREAEISLGGMMLQPAGTTGRGGRRDHPQHTLRGLGIGAKQPGAPPGMAEAVPVGTVCPLWGRSLLGQDPGEHQFALPRWRASAGAWGAGLLPTGVHRCPTLPDPVPCALLVPCPGGCARCRSQAVVCPHLRSLLFCSSLNFLLLGNAPRYPRGDSTRGGGLWVPEEHPDNMPDKGTLAAGTRELEQVGGPCCDRCAPALAREEEDAWVLALTWGQSPCWSQHHAGGLGQPAFSIPSLFRGFSPRLRGPCGALRALCSAPGRRRQGCSSPLLPHAEAPGRKKEGTRSERASSSRATFPWSWARKSERARAGQAAQTQAGTLQPPLSKHGVRLASRRRAGWHLRHGTACSRPSGVPWQQRCHGPKGSPRERIPARRVGWSNKEALRQRERTRA